MRHDEDRLRDILDAIDAILGKVSPADRQGFIATSCCACGACTT